MDSNFQYAGAVNLIVAPASRQRRSARRAKLMRRRSKYRFGDIPKCSWQHMRNVRSETRIALQISGM